MVTVRMGLKKGSINKEDALNCRDPGTSNKDSVTAPILGSLILPLTIKPKVRKQ